MKALVVVPSGLLLVALLGSCGLVDSGHPQPVTTHAEPGILRAAPEDATFTLVVSNQSFADDPVHLTLTVDGDPVIDQDFAVEGQHNWLRFGFAAPPGDHVVEATSDTGATLRQEFRLPSSGAPRYAVVNYWNYEDKHGRFLDWTFSRRSPVFD